MLVAMFLAALDQSIVAPALPTISAALGGGAWLSWIVAGYFLTSTAVMPLAGKLADLRGRRPVLYGSMAMFTLGSLVCAVAPTMAVLVAGRAIQGIGGGGLVASVQTVIGDVAPPRERARYTIYISTLWAIASTAGPVAGGVVAQHLHWSVIFWINLPIAAAAFALSSRALKRLPDTRRDHKLDVRGALLVIGATTLLLLALTWAGNTFPWGSPVIATLIAASLVLFALFARGQFRATEPLLPPRVLADPVVATACAAASLSTFCLVGLSVYFPVYLQMVEGMGPAWSGAALVFLMGGGVVGSNWSGTRMHRSPRYKWVALLGSSISAAALASLALLAGRVPVAILEVLIGLGGFGFGTLFPVALLSVQNASERRDLGVATSTIGFLRSLGGVIGLALLGAVAGATGIAADIGVPPTGMAARVGAAVGFRYLFLTVAVAQGLALCFLLLMEERPLRGDSPLASR